MLGCSSASALFGLAEEPLEHGRVLGQRPRQDLDGDLVAALDVDRAVDRAHAARPERLDQAVAADLAGPASRSSVGVAFGHRSSFLPRVACEGLEWRPGPAVTSVDALTDPGGPGTAPGSLPLRRLEDEDDDEDFEWRTTFSNSNGQSSDFDPPSRAHASTSRSGHCRTSDRAESEPHGPAPLKPSQSRRRWRPPSTWMTSPVENGNAPAASAATARPTSSGSPPAADRGEAVVDPAVVVVVDRPGHVGGDDARAGPRRRGSPARQAARRRAGRPCSARPWRRSTPPG